MGERPVHLRLAARVIVLAADEVLLMGDTAFSRASGNPLLAIERPLAV